MREDRRTIIIIINISDFQKKGNYVFHSTVNNKRNPFVYSIRTMKRHERPVYSSDFKLILSFDFQKTSIITNPSLHEFITWTATSIS